MPTLDARFIDLQKAAESKTYADELTGKMASYGLQITELSTHLQGQLVAVHPAYDDFFDGLKRSNISLPRYYKMLETRLFEQFKDLWKIYFGQDMSDKGIYTWEKSPLSGKKIQVYLKLKNLVEKGKKSGSHPDNKPINKDDDNYDLGRLDAVEHHNPTFKKIIFLRDAKKQLLNSEG